MIAITGVTRNFDCLNGPSGKAASQAIFESGSVVCAIIPKTDDQAIENGIMIWATRIGKLGNAPYSDIQKGLHDLAVRYRARLVREDSLNVPSEEVWAELHRIREEIAEHDYPA